MSILIKNVTVIDPGGPHHLEKKDIFIEKSRIQKIAKSIKQKAKKVIEGKDLHVSIGWMDIGTHSGEPGFEHRETFESLLKAAAAGGYTAIAIFPNTEPAMDNSTSIQSLNKIKETTTKIHPIGALSAGIESKDISEFIDMNAAGAIAFSDGLKSVNDNGLLMRALQYAKTFNGLIIHHPNDLQICKHGEMHEGPVSTSLGLVGIPSMAELSHVERDISLLEYTESRLLIHLISAKESIEAIRKAKKKNTALFTSVSFMNLIANDNSLQEFDSNYKLIPPLRTPKDQASLIKGIKDGSIDIIATNHLALEEELKKDAFPYTEAGAIGLQTCFSVCWEHLSNHIELSKLIELLAIKPRQILGLEIPKIKKDEPAELSVFDLDNEWTFDKSSNHSLSSNSAFYGKSFKARVKAVINGGNLAMF